MNESLNFVEAIIEEDILKKQFKEGIATRFPPEPNGYLHLGHAKSICLNFGLALTYKGRVNLRFDDTNPEQENSSFRLSLGGMVRLKGAYVILCDEIIKDQHGNISGLYCKYFPESKSGSTQQKIKVKSTIHWLSIPHAVPAEMRLYDKLFKVENPNQQGDDFLNHFNKNSIQVLQNAYVEKELSTVDNAGEHFQFIRLGYFIKDKNSRPYHLIFNKTADLKDSS